MQSLDAAVGDLNLDFYKITITSFPSGWDAPAFAHLLHPQHQSVPQHRLTELHALRRRDAQKLASPNPLGTVLRARHWRTRQRRDRDQRRAAAVLRRHDASTRREPATIRSAAIVSSAISSWTGVTTFYTRGADRATLGFPGTETDLFEGGERLWQSFQSKLAAFINDNGGDGRDPRAVQRALQRDRGARGARRLRRGAGARGARDVGRGRASRSTGTRSSRSRNRRMSVAGRRRRRWCSAGATG